MRAATARAPERRAPEEVSAFLAQHIDEVAAEIEASVAALESFAAKYEDRADTRRRMLREWAALSDEIRALRDSEDEADRARHADLVEQRRELYDMIRTNDAIMDEIAEQSDSVRGNLERLRPMLDRAQALLDEMAGAADLDPVPEFEGESA